MRYEVEQLHGLSFVLLDVLEGGVDTSLNFDSHGKTFSDLILGMSTEE